MELIAKCSKNYSRVINLRTARNFAGHKNRLGENRDGLSRSLSQNAFTTTTIRNRETTTPTPPYFHYDHQRRTFTTQNQNLSSTDDFKIEVSNGVRRLTFNRPSKKKAVSMEMGMNFLMGFVSANSDDETKIVVLTGNGEYFTSGMDLGGMSKKPPPSTEGQNDPPPAKKRKPGGIVEKFIGAIVNCEKPLIALVNGPAMGFGVTMLGLFDAVYASDRATFQTNFTRYQVPPEFGSTYTFPRIMGYGKASDLLLFNQKMTAEEAYKCGFVSRVIEHDKFEEVTSKLVESYAELPLKSLIYSKELVKGGKFKERMMKVSEHEQSYFDPEIARQVIKQFMADKDMAK